MLIWLMLIVALLIWILLGAVAWPKHTEEVIKAYEIFGYSKLRHESFFYNMAKVSSWLNGIIFRKKREREEAARQEKIQENRSAKSWKCLTCGKVNLGVQEMCACGQRRDDQ